MIAINDINKFSFSKVPIDKFWNTGGELELKMHRIHAYPAKFPSFITTKALEYAKQKKAKVGSIADIFCGCGTTAFEAKRNNKIFWGCDINPIATLIAKTKSRKYQKKRLERHFNNIINDFKARPVKDKYPLASERLKYWYKKKQYNELFHLKESIFRKTSKNSDYQLFFLCAFSNILKATSSWLTKSIKPQVDPDKKPANVCAIFKKQYKFMLLANQEIVALGNVNSEIITGNFLERETVTPKVDLIVTSPPYVTSYEYADLHQLSSMWLGIADDYRTLREGSIGSVYHDYNFKREWKRLNTTGNRIVSLLLDQHKSKAHAVTKYFLDMQKVAVKSRAMLNKKGMALFVIGNTAYKNIRIDNAKHLAESLLDAGFSKVLVTKRKISNKILTPYRDERGKFSTDKKGRMVYSEEFILIGRN